MENFQLAQIGAELLDEAPKVEVQITEAAAEHVAAWDVDQRVMAIHEAGHAVIGAALGIPIKAVDIKGRHTAHTEVGIHDDNLPETVTGQNVLDEMTMMLAAGCTERLLIGQGTMGSADDLQRATGLAYRRFNAGLDDDAPFIAPEGIPFAMTATEMEAEFYRAAVATLAECRLRAEKLVATHREAIIAFAAILYAKRRLDGSDLRDALAKVGVKPAA
jgi:ATP-dependent Zn protease